MSQNLGKSLLDSRVVYHDVALSKDMVPTVRPGEYPTVPDPALAAVPDVIETQASGTNRSGP
jgi:hypothetical protein